MVSANLGGKRFDSARLFINLGFFSVYFNAILRLPSEHVHDRTNSWCYYIRWTQEQGDATERSKGQTRVVLRFIIYTSCWPWTCLPPEPALDLSPDTIHPFVNYRTIYAITRRWWQHAAGCGCGCRSASGEEEDETPTRHNACEEQCQLPHDRAAYGGYGAAAVLALTLVWVLHFRGGVSWKPTSSHLFVYTAHPLFMVIGFIICTGEAVMAYRIVLGPRAAKKAMHILLHLVALAFAAVGLYAAFKFHHDTGLPDIRSLHSWLGIATIALYALQWLVAFVYFVFPRAVMTMRADYAPWHIFFGLAIFLMAVCTAEAGLAKFVSAFIAYPSKVFVVNFTGIAILMFAVVVVLAVTLPSRY